MILNPKTAHIILAREKELREKRNASEHRNENSLGINTKSSVDFEYIKYTESPVFTRNERTNQLEYLYSEEDRKLVKFQRLSTAREVLYSKEKAENYKKSLIKNEKVKRFDLKKNREVVSYKNVNKQHRTFHCHYDLNAIATAKGTKATRDNDPSLEIHKRIEDGKIFTKGQFLCSSVWTCPVCSSKITEGRKNDIQKAFMAHRQNGGAIYENDGNKLKTIKEAENSILLLTLTLPHYLKDDLKELMSKIRVAITHFKKSRIYTSSLKALSFIGEIRALETTWSQLNGWHPHFHSILFFEEEVSQIQQRKLKSLLLKEWQNSCIKAGLKKPTKHHGLDIQDGSQAQNYVNKWGIEHEVSKWTSKNGKKNSLSPFQILDLYAEEQLQEKKNYYRKLYNEYAQAFHGFRQLYWSPKLKEKFGIIEKEDEELAEEDITKETLILASLTLEEWKLLRKHKQKHIITSTNLPLIYHITKIVKEKGIDELLNLINKLRLMEIERNTDKDEFENECPF